MKVTLTASTAAKIVVWMEDDDLYHARRLGLPERPQVCLAVDLFEVIAELGGLNLEEPAQAAEATSLSEQAQAQLTNSGTAAGGPLSDCAPGESVTRESAP